MVAATLGSLAAITVISLFLGSVPLPQAVPAPQASRILASDGQLVATLHGEENRTIVALSEFAPVLRQAVIAAEDRGFYGHSGLSPRGVLRAAFANVRAGGVRQGGSTITQQYVRSAFASVGRERTVFRKAKEAALAVKLERIYSKDKILEFYLNTVYFGRGAYGAEAAARTYFSKPARQVSLPEAAYLAGAIRAPGRFQPDRSPEAATAIRNVVLDDMVAAGFVNRSEAEAAGQQALAFSLGRGSGRSARAAFFVEYVRRLLSGGDFRLTDQQILSGGLEIHTTLDLRMQDAAERAIASTLDRPEDPEAALVAIDPSGNIRAMVGGRDFTSQERARGFNFAYQKGKATGGRLAGSAFKPFTLAAFVDQGYSVQSVFAAPAETVISSEECSEGDKPWTVENFDRESFPSLTVAEATAHSVNTVYAQMMDLLKPEKVAPVIRDLGIDLPPGEVVCSLSLGTLGATPLEMARAYATFAGRGERPEVLGVTKVVGQDGRVLARRSPRRADVLDPEVADSINAVLQGVLEEGTGRRAELGRPAAGKTGTTQNHVDAWFVGYTPTLVSAVWMGFPPDPADGRIPGMSRVHGVRVTGGSFPATIWKSFMTEALKGSTPVGFGEARVGGEVLKPPPRPCSGQPSPGCVKPSPEATSPSPSVSPALPVPIPRLSPRSSPGPSPTPSPTPEAPKLIPTPPLQPPESPPPP